MFNNRAMKYIALAIILLITSCHPYQKNNRVKLANDISAQGKLTKRIIGTKNFFLTTYSKFTFTLDRSDIMHVYIEGDGYAWKNRYQPSKDPTPINPIGLRMAVSDFADNILYIARPCQYTDLNIDKKCNKVYWTGSRFSQEVITSINQTINYFQNKYQIKNVAIYGHSGGGALAVLVASQRKDVREIGTIAANLNHKKLNKLHGVTPLNDSLDAIDVVDKVKSIPQFHIAGGEDGVVFPGIIGEFVGKVKKAGGKVKLQMVPKAGHEYPSWDKVWLTTMEKTHKY